MANMHNFWTAFAEVCEEVDKAQKKVEEAKAEERKAFDENVDEKKFNRGTVVSAMAAAGCTSYEMERVLKQVHTPEQAEAAVGLIKSGNYTSYDIERILKTI